MKDKVDYLSYDKKAQEYQPYAVGFDDYKKNFNSYSALSKV